jgi:ribose transport system permease protein
MVDIDTNPKMDPRKNIFGPFGRALNNFPEINLIFIIAVIWIVLSFASKNWNTWGNIRAIMMSFSIEGIVVIAMTIMLIVGGFDLSVGSVMALTMIISGQLFLMGVNPWIASIIAVIAAACIGAVIGFFVTKIGLNFLITTLAIMVVARGACYVLTKGTPLSLFELPASFKFIGQGRISGIPFVVIVFFIIVIFGDFMLRKSSVLRKVIYTGSNERAAILSGINTSRVKFVVCILTSAIAGFAGILYMAKFGGATAQFGTGLEITAISAAIIGGASLSGGKGTVLGAVLGIAFLQIITGAMVMLSVSVYWQDFIRGLILLLAVTLDHIRQSRRRVT